MFNWFKKKKEIDTSEGEVFYIINKYGTSDLIHILGGGDFWFDIDFENTTELYLKYHLKQIPKTEARKVIYLGTLQEA